MGRIEMGRIEMEWPVPSAAKEPIPGPRLIISAAAPLARASVPAGRIAHEDLSCHPRGVASTVRAVWRGVGHVAGGEGGAG